MSNVFKILRSAINKISLFFIEIEKVLPSVL